MSYEVAAGLRNALERGESLELAVRTFINAGYNPYEVKQAAKSLTEGNISEIVYGNEMISSENEDKHINSSEEVQDKKENFSYKPLVSQIKPKKNEKLMLVIIIGVILFFLLGALGFLVYKLLK